MDATALHGPLGSFPDREITEDEYTDAVAIRKNLPVLLMADHRRYLWWFCDRVYHYPNSEHDPEVIKGLITQKMQRTERRRQWAVETAKHDDIKT